MSTRCNVTIEDTHSKLWFYRHSDGYPSATAESLKRFLRWVLDGKIRDNAGQASGWLVLLGAVEYQALNANLFPEGGKRTYDQDHDAVKQALEAFNQVEWKCGAYEPTVGQHGDIEYLYVIDLAKKEIRCCKPRGEVFHTITRENIDVPVEG